MDWFKLYSKLLDPKRLKGPDSNKKTRIQHAQSDNARIIYSSPFRRMQQKAQVFSLERNAAVRSRLTHTLEVAHIGRLIAERVVQEKFNIKEYKEYDLAISLIRIVENACLLHDIGNPPFGHFGESAIQKWFYENWKQILLSNTIIESTDADTRIFEEYFNDFFYFDGNPQGIRIAVSLQEKPDDKTDTVEGTELSSMFGFNLTYPQILSFLKYTQSPNTFKNSKESKPGYFISEEEKINKIRAEIGFQHRFPLVFLMEAADDISYCLSDIEDGIEKKLISAQDFFDELSRILREHDIYSSIDNLFKITGKKSKTEFYDFKIEVTKHFTTFVVSEYIKHHDKILEGEVQELLNTDSTEGKLLEAIKQVSRRKLYRSWEAEKTELAGYKIIYGLLDNYKGLLCCPYDNKFKKLIQFSNGENISFKGLNLDVELRLFNRLPEKHLAVYKDSLRQIQNDPEFKIKEIFNRCHLIIDYISGMTDNYSLDVYRTLNGITL